MTTRAATLSGAGSPAPPSPALLWSGCLVAVLMLHVALVALLLRQKVEPVALPPQLPAIEMDLPPEQPAAPPPTPLAIPAIPPLALAPPVPPLPPMPLAPPTPPITPEPPPPLPDLAPPPLPALPPAPDPEVALPLPPVAPPPPSPPHLVPRPRVVPPPVRAAPRPNQEPIRAPQAATAVPLSAPPAPTATAPPPAPASNAVPTWRGELMSRLQRAKRYPEEARSRGDRGIVLTTFTLDRSGRVLAASVARSSGVISLDEEAVALIRRAEPLPPLPPEITGNSVTLTVPIVFSIQ